MPDIGALWNLISQGPEGWVSFIAISTFRWFASFFTFVMTSWMRLSPADVFLGDLDNSAGPVQVGQLITRSITIALVVVSFVYSISKSIISQRLAPMGDLVLMIVRVIVTYTAVVSFTFVLLKGADIAGPWLAGQISGLGAEQVAANPFPVSQTLVDSQAKGAAAVPLAIGMASLLPIAAISGFINFLFVIGSFVIIILILIWLPTLAAQSVSAAGKDRFDKAVGWLVAAALYKIFGGVVIGVAIQLFTLNMFGGDKASLEGFGGAPMGFFLTGWVAMLMSILILPVLIKLAVPGMRAASGFSVGKIMGAIAITAGMAAGAAAGAGLISSGAGAGAGSAGSSGPGTAGGATGGGTLSSDATNGATSGGGLNQSGATNTAAPSGTPPQPPAPANPGSPANNQQQSPPQGEPQEPESRRSRRESFNSIHSAQMSGQAIAHMATEHGREAEESLGEGDKLV